jgi:hypothetical protein
MTKRSAVSNDPVSSRPRMPKYGIPADRKGLLSWRWAKQRLERSHNYWITTVRPDGAPHTMVVWGLWLGGSFWFSTGSRSRKARNLAANARCVVCTERADEAVVVEGEACIQRDPSKLRAFFRRYKTKYDWDASELQGMPVFAVEPHVAFGLCEETFQTSATRWQWAAGAERGEPGR